MDHPKIVRCAVYPPIGCARVGNSETGWFLGPEVPGRAEVPPDGYKENGRIKRQGARFRVYGFDEGGRVTGELTLESARSVEWTVHVANRKASWYAFNNSLDLAVVAPERQPPMAPPISAVQRNNNVLGAARASLDIDPGEHRIGGPGQEGTPMIGDFQGTPVTLGQLRTDEAGRLIFLGGFGISASPSPANPIQNFSNNSGWYDDISDGWVKARVTLRDGTVLDAEPGWVFTGPPDYAPAIQPLITLYDLMRSVAVDAGWMEAPEQPSFTADIWPLLNRLGDLQWVSESANLLYGWQTELDFLDPELIRALASPSEESRPARERIFQSLRSPMYDQPGDPPVPFQSADSSELRPTPSPTEYERIPFLLGDGIDYPGSPMQWFAIPPLFYEMMRKWARGDFIDDWKGEPQPPASLDEIPLREQPDALTRAALEPVFGGAFHPGVELTWPMRHKRLYSAPFRLRHDPGPATETDYGYLMTGEIAMAPDGPLRENHPGYLTRWMGLPWQSDAASCQNVYLPQDFPVPVWWPANLPVDVLPRAYYERLMDPGMPAAQRRKFFDSRLGWSRGVGAVGYHAAGGYTQSMIHMVNDWSYLGMVTPRPGPEDGGLDVPAEMYVEMERAELEG
ncbi:MAG TPA: LodA/GoxA family CTQ-dependent oxidase [Longimicrobium sp.]|nr:LodA/GoxA family CTQ-dependent oxidase [Longimicrobium sp.]